jgi:hypothetical protein
MTFGPWSARCPTMDVGSHAHALSGAVSSAAKAQG